ncbi:Uma2 family endonuclease [Roseofilum casamattae]|uniref:Uma2 family endonuclease n=1 Tax=Roseofilum casamattae BLCC-M143 TaxID=3022442 RepID=A0ABT7C1H1_9CYAN|nr:Uma2 family endonuclease [Roseofilum casamattae]MDJ1185293.1 Uma2 family endonuclease [Roseofilum casamattae BLCC-M143]
MTLSRSLTSQFAPQKTLPPLENGDRLTSPEFERRYSAMPEVKKAELIEGIVYMASPLRFEPHAEPHGDMMGWLWTYKIATSQVRIGIEPTVRLDIDNEPQPDGVLLISPESGGSSSFSADGYIDGAPELVIEIAASSAAIDLGDKQRAYRRNGIQEYIVWQIFEERIDWFHLDNGDYISLLPNADGVICSQVFPGLCLDVSAMRQGDMQRVLAVLQEGINSTEHQAFVQELAARSQETSQLKDSN